VCVYSPTIYTRRSQTGGGIYEIKPKGSHVGEKEKEKHTSGGEIGCEKESPKDDESIRRTYPLKNRKIIKKGVDKFIPRIFRLVVCTNTASLRL
jgi:hypothetical protein